MKSWNLSPDFVQWHRHIAKNELRSDRTLYGIMDAVLRKNVDTERREAKQENTRLKLLIDVKRTSTIVTVVFQTNHLSDNEELWSKKCSYCSCQFYFEAMTLGEQRKIFANALRAGEI